MVLVFYFANIWGCLFGLVWFLGFFAVVVVALGKVGKWAECKVELSGIIGVVFSFLFPCSWLECVLLGIGRAAMRHPHWVVLTWG